MGADRPLDHAGHERPDPDVAAVDLDGHRVIRRQGRHHADEQRGTVFLKRRGMQIGLGGVAKGWFGE